MKNVKRGILWGLFILIGFSGIPQILYAQNTPTKLREAYLTPPEDISSEVLAPRYKNVTLSDLGPNRESFLTYKNEGMAPLDLYAKPYYNLGGLQIDPHANRQRYFTLVTGYFRTQSADGIELVDAKDGKKHNIQIPDGAHVSDATWSPDGSKMAYFAHFDDATYIYVADLKNGHSHQITKRPVLATLTTSFKWSADGKYIFAVLVPKDRGDAPQKPATAASPEVRMTTPDKNRLRTYKDLLQDSFEVNLLEYYITGQLARINVDNQNVKEIGEPAMIRDISVAPDGRYTMVQKLQKPFSYIVPVSNFGWTREIWDLNGKALVTLQTSEVREGIPDHKTEKDYGRSDIKWRPDGKGLSLIVGPNDDEDKKDDNANDENSGQKDKKPEMYRLVQWMPPFGKDDQHVIYTSKKKMQSASYAEDSDVVFIQERPSGKEHLYAVYPGHADTTYTIYNYKRDDFYKDPGNLLYKTARTGLPVVQLTSDKESVFLSGTQHYKDPQKNAPRPFIDQIDIQSGNKKRIFQSSDDAYEQVAAVLDDNINEIVVTRETPQDYPDSWLINLNSGNKTKLTSNIDYNKDITQAQHNRFKVKRSDGFEFWIDVILPQHWDGKPLPGLIWHYPTEYDDQKDYDESTRRFNKNQFPRLNQGWPERAPEILVKRGYAVIKADWPIASERGGPNDGFVWSIVQNSTVVIDSCVARGYVDRDRMAIGGHSYGAFGTANAMIHTSFFKAGIAGDGNYNRTLTPLGFQRQPRDLWRGQSRYIQMSPIFWADQLDGALLMYHGGADQNVGTWPTNSKRMFQALNALGKPAALYVYPYEAHHAGAKATVLDRWTRWVNWLDHYVKEKGKPVPESELGES